MQLSLKVKAAVFVLLPLFLSADILGNIYPLYCALTMAERNSLSLMRLDDIAADILMVDGAWQKQSNFDQLHLKTWLKQILDDIHSFDNNQNLPLSKQELSKIRVSCDNESHAIQASLETKDISPAKISAMSMELDKFTEEFAEFRSSAKDQYYGELAITKNTPGNLLDNMLHLLIAGAACQVFAIASFSLLFGKILSGLQRLQTNLRAAKTTGVSVAKIQADEFKELDALVLNFVNQTAEFLKRESALIDNLRDIVCSLDAQLRFVRVSGAADELWGLSPAALQGLPLGSVVPPVELEKIAQPLREMREKEMATQIGFEHFVLLPTKVEKRWFRWSVYWSPWEKAYFCVARDMTAERQTAELKNDLLNMVSHDLRTPVTSTLLFLDIVSSGRFGALNARGSDLIAKQKSALGRLVKLVNEFLDLQKLNSGLQLKITQTLAVELAISAIQMVEHVASANDIKLELIEECSEDCSLEVDEMRIVETLQNIIGNAIRFSPKGGIITLTVKQSPDNFIFYYIDDEGTGIPESEQDTVFEKFRQLPSNQNAGLGTSGLGLAICKQVVIMHKGEIGVEQSKLGGARFWLKLPALRGAMIGESERSSSEQTESES